MKRSRFTEEQIIGMLKKIVADLTLDRDTRREMLQDVIRRKL